MRLVRFDLARLSLLRLLFILRFIRKKRPAEISHYFTKRRLRRAKRRSALLTLPERLENLPIMLHVPFAARLDDNLERRTLACVLYLRERIGNRVNRVVIEVGVILERQCGILGEVRNRSERGTALGEDVIVVRLRHQVRVGKYRQELFFKEIALPVRYRRIELEFGTVCGHGEFEREVMRLAVRGALDRQESRIKLFHAGDKLFERLCTRIRLGALRTRQRDLVERHMKRFETWCCLVDTRSEEPRRDIAHEVAVEIVRDVRIVQFFEHGEHVLDALFLHRPLQTLDRLFAPAEIEFSENRLRFAVLRHFINPIFGNKHRLRRSMMRVDLFGDNARTFDRTGRFPNFGELRFLARYLLAQIGEFLFRRGQLRRRFHFVQYTALECLISFSPVYSSTRLPL